MFEKLNQIDTMNEVLEVIGNLKDNKPLGLYDIYLTVFKELKYEIASLLMIICNLSLNII